MEIQRIELSAQRQKLLEAHYAGAIPLDLLKSEQDRIAGQLARIQDRLTNLDATFEQARAMLADTLDLTRDCHPAYQEANESTRRLFNQAFFTKIYIDEDDETREQTVRMDYNEPFDSLLSRLVPAHVHHELDIKKTAHREIPKGGTRDLSCGIVEVQGSHTDTLVALSDADAESWKNLKLRSHDSTLRSTDNSKNQYGEVGTLRQVQHRLTASDVAIIKARRTHGVSLKSIAMELNCHRHTVSLHLHAKT